MKLGAVIGTMALAAFFPGPVLAQARTDATVIVPTDPRQAAEQDRLGYASAVIAGDFVFLSGVIAWRQTPDEPLAAAYERAFRQMGTALEKAGAGWSDVVDMTSYHTDPNGQIEALAAVKKRFIEAPHPAWTAIGVAGLLGERGITEIKLTAYRAGVKKAG